MLQVLGFLSIPPKKPLRNFKTFRKRPIFLKRLSRWSDPRSQGRKVSGALCPLAGAGPRVKSRLSANWWRWFFEQGISWCFLGGFLVFEGCFLAFLKGFLGISWGFLEVLVAFLVYV